MNLNSLLEIATCCKLCPRECKVKRGEGKAGSCRIPTLYDAYVASWGPHYGEERCISGFMGSGTIFFSGCNLHCVFCQNYDISQRLMGKRLTFKELADIMLYLAKSCHNINLVSPTHQIVSIVKALLFAKEKGLSVPVVYNCGGYEKPQVISLLDDLIDIYMPDFKYSDNDLAVAYSSAPLYVEYALSSLKEMYNQKGPLTFDKNGVALSGVLVRHLVLPGHIENSIGVLDLLNKNFSLIHVNVMDQFYPAYKSFDIPPLNRRLTSKEYYTVLDYANSLPNIEVIS